MVSPLKGGTKLGVRFGIPLLDPVHLEYRPLTTSIARAVPAGQAAAHAVWFWMHLISWPSDLTPKKGDPGITVIELLCNFLVYWNPVTSCFPS